MEFVRDQRGAMEIVSGKVRPKISAMAEDRALLREAILSLLQIHKSGLNQPLNDRKIIAVETPNRSIPFAVSNGPSNFQEGDIITSP